MADATTEDCKAFIEAHAKELGVAPGEKWKRIGKAKTEEGWSRSFQSASGSMVEILEPFGSGVAGLRAAGAGMGAGAEGASDFNEATAEFQAAMRWVDAMRVVGGKAPMYSKDAGGGWSWARFKKGIHDFTGHEDRGDSYEMVENWAQEGMKDASGAALMISRCAWCFASDADYCEREGYYKPIEGALVMSWAVDCPDEEEGWLPHPMIYMKEFGSSSEGIYEAGVGSPTGLGAMRLAWEQLHEAGVKFDIKAQKELGQDSDYDEDEPLHKKVWRVIPQLAAEKEARAIAKSAGMAPTPAAPKRRSI